MSRGTGPGERSYWSTRQQLIVVTGHTEEAAVEWLQALRDLEESCRDVIDYWQGEQPLDLEDMDARVAGLRRALHDFRQWDRSP